MKKYIIALGFMFAVPSLALASSTSFNASLSYGSTGSAVTQLQEFLVSQKCLSANPTGYFGSLTLAGVKCFQNKYGISDTGYFGLLSRAMANQILNISANPSAYQSVQGTQSQVNLSQGTEAAPTISSLSGGGTTTIIVQVSTTSVYSLSPLVGSGVVPPASTSMSQGANATPGLSPLIDNDSPTQ